MSDYRTFVVPFDFSTHARAALFAATDLAKRLGADLHLIHVIQAPTYAYGYGAYLGESSPLPVNTPEIRKTAENRLRKVADDIEGLTNPIGTHVVEGRRIASEISDFAEKLGADMIVMGTHGRTGLAHVFLGSVAERTLRIAACPVLTVQAPEDSEEEEG